MKRIVIVPVLALVLLCRVAHAEVGPYVSWSATGWFPGDKLGKVLDTRHTGENSAQFALIVGARLSRHIAIEAFTAPALQRDEPTIDVEGIDAKILWPLGPYVTPYVRLRLARMTVGLDPVGHHTAQLSGIGGGEGGGIQFQFPGRMFGLIMPAWFAAPLGFKGIGGIWTEVTHETYELGTASARGTPERFWRYAYGVAWGFAF